MSIIEADLREGYIFRLVLEIIKNNVKAYNFVFNEDFISIKCRSNRGHKLFNIKIYGDRIPNYNVKESIQIGVNAINMNQLLKSITKKDSLRMRVYGDDIDNMMLCSGKEDDNKTYTSMRIIKVQTDIIDTKGLDSNKDYEISVNSKDFCKKIKDLSIIKSKVLVIKSKKGKIKMLAGKEGIFESEVEFEKEVKSDEEYYIQSYMFNDLYELSKLMKQSHLIKINAEPYKPLKITIFLGAIGKMVLHIKSIDMIEKEENI